MPEATRRRERWRKVRRADGYQVSDRGRVRSVTRTLSDGRTAGGVMLSQFEDRDGYLCVNIGGRPVAVHVLVTDAFLDECPPGHERLHGEGGQKDNSVTNLRFGTHLENERDKRRTERQIGRVVSPPFSIGTSVTGGEQR